MPQYNTQNQHKMDRGFHASDAAIRSYTNLSIERALQSGQMIGEDAKLIREFVSELRSTHSISNVRVKKIVSHLVNWRRFIGPFTENSIFDLYRGIDDLKEYRNTDGTQYAQNTRRDYITFLKRFYLWLIENKYSSIPEKKINAISPPAKNRMTKTVEQLLSEDDIRRMLECCTNSRDRALFSMMYEGAFRAGELGNLKWNQVKFNNWNVVINVNDKTGKPRYIPLVSSRSYLAQWMNDYPYDISSDAYVFLTTNTHKPLMHQTILKQVKIISKRAGIKRNVTPHIFRHSRITHLIQKGYGESIIKKMCWGNITTEMFATYAHLTDADIEHEIAIREGIEIEDPSSKHSEMEPRQCMNCYTVNSPTSRYCDTCGTGLVPGAVNELNQAKEQAELLPQYQKLLDEFEQKLREMQNANAS